MRENLYKVGDSIMVSPYLTHKSEWIKGKIVSVEENSLNGTIISAEMPDGDVFFQRADPDYFREI